MAVIDAIQGDNGELLGFVKITRDMTERREAERRALESEADYLALAAQWVHLARGYEFSESLERFLLDSQRAKDALAPQPPEPE